MENTNNSSWYTVSSVFVLGVIVVVVSVCIET